MEAINTTWSAWVRAGSIGLRMMIYTSFGQAVLLPAPEFDCWRDGAIHGRVISDEYTSRSLGVHRRLMVYYPPGFLPSVRYPVLFLLHGLSDDETAWTRKGALEPILDNLYAEGRLVPMLVVMPNGRVSTSGTAEMSWGAQRMAFDAFAKEMVHSILPHVDSHYPVLPDREHRAVVGISWGARQALTLGSAHPDLFAWVGAVSVAGIGADTSLEWPTNLAPRLRWLGVYSAELDPLYARSAQFHLHLEQARVEHEWWVDAEGHSWKVWKRGLHRFSQHLFR